MANFFDQFDAGPSSAASSAQSPYADAIASIESAGSGNYRAVGPATRTGDRAFGRYQIMGQNIRPWSKEVLGREVTPQEFMANPQLQDQIFSGKFGQYVDKYGPEGAARAWFAGEKGMNDPNRRDVLGTSVAQYGQRFAQAAGVQPSQPMAFAPERQPMSLLPPEVTSGASQQQAAPTEASAQSRQPSANFFDQFDNMPAEPTFNERFGGDIPQPQNAGAVTSDLRKLATDKTTGPETSIASQIATDFMNQGSAASQGTTPNIRAQQPNLVSTETTVDELGNLLYRDPQSGQWLQTDSAKQVALRDPADGRVKVFARTADNNEGALSSLGRIAMSGLATGAPTGVSVARNAQAVVKPLTEGQEVANAASRLSETGAPVQIPRAVTTDSVPLQRAASTVRSIPGAGEPLVGAADRALTQLGTKADEVAAGFGSGTVQGAGDTTKGAIRSWIKGESGKKVGQLYDRVDNLVNQQSKTALVNTRGVAAEIAAERGAAMQGPGKAVDFVLEAANSDGLTYQGIKKLRTMVGEMMNGGILPEGVSGAELKRIYSGLTDDLRSSVRVGGGEKAVEAFDRANRYNRLVSDRREALAKIVGANGDTPAEKVFDRLRAMAGSNSRADVNKLAQARKAIGADDWNEFASGVVSGLGRDAAGNFSADRFVTDYGKLSDAGKSLLFRSGGKSNLADSLDDIAKVSSRYKQLAKFGNPSGTGQIGAGLGIGAGFMVDPLTTISSVVGGRALAYALSQPATASSVAKLVRAQEALVRVPSTGKLAAYNVAARNLINTLGEAGRGISPDQFMKALQGGMPSRAKNEQPESERVINR